MDSPLIEPDVSMTKITSRGVLIGFASCGGMNISSTCSP